MIKYIKTLWENAITPVNGKNLNKIEDALEYLHDIIRNVPNEENVRIANEKQRQTNETTRSNDEIKRNANFDSKIKDVDKAINASSENIKEVNNKFESISASKQQDAEVIIARDREVSLNARLKRDLYIDDVPLKQRVLDLESLKEMQDFEYETNKGYLVCKDTKNGVVKDLKLNGKSIVNIAPKIVNRITLSKDKRISDIKLNKVVPASTEFTVGINVAAKKAPLNGLLISFRCTDGTYIYDTLTTGVYSQFKNFKLNKEIESISLYLHLDELASDNTVYITFDSLLICEGVVNTYFEGIASVGNNNQIEVSSVKSDGNLFDTENLYFGSIKSISPNAYYYDLYDFNSSIFNRLIGKPIFLPNGAKKIFFKCEGYEIAHAYFGKDLRLIRDSSWQPNTTTITPKSNENYIGSYIRKSDNSNLTQTDIDFVKNNAIVISTDDYNSIKYELYKADKKTILYKDTDGDWKPIKELRGIDLSVCDTIEKHSDDKHYLHLRTGKRVLNGSETWGRQSVNDTLNTERYSVPLSDIKFSSDGISDILPYVKEGGNDDKTCIYAHNDTYSVHIRKLKTDTRWSDVNTLKTWLQTNNVTVIYQLAKEQIYEVNPLDLESFEGGTMISIDSGVIAPYASWKITSYLPNFVRNLSSQVRQLQDQVYKTNVANFTVALNTLDTKLRLNKLEAPNN